MREADSAARAWEEPKLRLVKAEEVLLRQGGEAKEEEEQGGAAVIYFRRRKTRRLVLDLNLFLNPTVLRPVDMWVLEQAWEGQSERPGGVDRDRKEEIRERERWQAISQEWGLKD